MNIKQEVQPWDQFQKGLTLQQRTRFREFAGDLIVTVVNEGHSIDEAVQIIRKRPERFAANFREFIADQPQIKEERKTDMTDEEDEVERCPDCGCTPEEGACVYCKMD